MLLITIDSKAVLLRGLAALKDLKYEEVMTMYKSHYEPPPLEHYHFQLCNQEVGDNQELHRQTSMVGF